VGLFRRFIWEVGVLVEYYTTEKIEKTKKYIIIRTRSVVGQDLTGGRVNDGFFGYFSLEPLFNPVFSFLW
jgi:hypothetical protein